MIQDPVSTMQKTGWTIHSFFLVLCGLKKSFTLDKITRGHSTTIFLCFGPFSAWWRTNKRTNNRVILEQAYPWPVWEGSLLQFYVCNENCYWFYKHPTSPKSAPLQHWKDAHNWDKAEVALYLKEVLTTDRFHGTFLLLHWTLLWNSFITIEICPCIL